MARSITGNECEIVMNVPFLCVPAPSVDDSGRLYLLLATRDRGKAAGLPASVVLKFLPAKRGV
jgi:hypothetical protein